MEILYRFMKSAAPMTVRFSKVNIVALTGDLDSFCVLSTTKRRLCLHMFMIHSYDVTIYFTCHNQTRFCWMYVSKDMEIMFLI
jgi:hypothetical protein